MPHYTMDSTHHYQAQLDDKSRSKIDHTLKLIIYLYCIFYVSSYLKSLSFQKKLFHLNMFKLSAITILSGKLFQLFITVCEKLNCL